MSKNDNWAALKDLWSFLKLNDLYSQKCKDPSYRELRTQSTQGTNRFAKECLNDNLTYRQT
jgi:hypothetical protein